MRRFLHKNKWVTAMVVALFMVATSGMAISRMTCLAGGHTVFSVGLASDCCPEPEQGTEPTITAMCCELSLTQGGRDMYLPNDGMDLLPTVLILDGAVVSLVQPAPVAVSTWLQSRPPPLPVLERLAVLSVQRV
jgi:hypothetical protein